MPHSYQGHIGHHPELDDTLLIVHATIVNAPDGSRKSYRQIATLPSGASPEDIAQVFGETARRSLLAAMEAQCIESPSCPSLPSPL